MADANCTTNQPCIIVQTPKAPAEVNWVEAAHGIESIFTIIGLAIGAWWAYRNDWIKSAKDRKDDRELRKKEQEQREDTLNQRNRQLRWDQAKLAKEINDQFLDDHDAQEALGIVDSDALLIEITDDDKNPVVRYRVSLENGKHITALQINPKGANVPTADPPESQDRSRDTADRSASFAFEFAAPWCFSDSTNATA